MFWINLISGKKKLGNSGKNFLKFSEIKPLVNFKNFFKIRVGVGVEVGVRVGVGVEAWVGLGLSVFTTVYFQINIFTLF